MENVAFEIEQRGDGWEWSLLRDGREIAHSRERFISKDQAVDAAALFAELAAVASESLPGRG